MNRTDNTDQELRELLRKSNFNAPPSPWFTRKVMNRLPRKSKRNMAWVEYAVYIISAILIGVFGIRYATDTLHSGVIRIADITAIATYLCAFCAVIMLIVTPWTQPETSSGE